jgi:hypothetical protein
MTGAIQIQSPAYFLVVFPGHTGTALNTEMSKLQSNEKFLSSNRWRESGKMLKGH